MISRRQVEGNDPLLLVLARLIVGVGNLQPVARRHEVQVKRIPGAGLIIDAIEESPGVSDVMDGPELGRIEKPAGPLGVEDQKGAEARAAQTERRFFAY